MRQVKVNASHCCQLASERHTTNLNKQYFFDHQCGNSFAGKFIITRVWLMCRGFAIVWLFVFGFFAFVRQKYFWSYVKNKKKIASGIPIAKCKDRWKRNSLSLCFPSNCSLIFVFLFSVVKCFFFACDLQEMTTLKNFV